MSSRSRGPSGTGPVSGDAVASAVLFDADGTDREVALGQVDLRSLSERQLLWVDLQCGTIRPAAQWLRGQGLDIDDAALDTHEGRPRLQNFGDWFLIQATAVAPSEKREFSAQALALVSGRNFVVTVHREPLAYLTQLRERERGDTQLGVLSAERFTSSLMDWLLATYFDAVAELEVAVDRIEVQVLTRRFHSEHLPELSQARRMASRLRRMLAPHRALFGAMARPDFRPDEQGESDPGLRVLNERFERAMDAVENARDLVVGSFELVATRTAQRTNETMRVLTFFTVLLGTLALVAGVLGMNFESRIFGSGDRGFMATIAVMLAIVAGALSLARWRRWW